MRRDSTELQNIFPKTVVGPAPNNYFVYHPENSYQQRQQPQPPWPTQTLRTVESPPHSYQRLSLESGPHPNNAFAHLRNQISNLRTEFSKLIQKDNGKVSRQIGNSNDPKEKEILDSFGIKRENRLPTYSLITMQNTQFGRNGEKIEKAASVNTPFMFKSKVAQLQTKPQNDNVERRKTQDLKFLGRTVIERNVPIDFKQQNIQSTKMKELQVQIVKLGELKRKAEDETAFLRRQLGKKEQMYGTKLREIGMQLQQAKAIIQQTNISLSLKNSLVEKLQKQNEKQQREKKLLISQNQSLRSQIDKIKQKSENQIINLEEVHRNNITEVVQKYRVTEQHLLTSIQEKSIVSKQLKEKEQKLQSVQRQKQEIQAKYKNKNIEINQWQMKEQNARQRQQFLQKKIEELESTILSLRKSKEINQVQQQIFRIKSIEQQNIDLKKRVESYKKSVQQLNSTNNSSREKLVQAKQEVRELKQDSTIKQALINSLYRDISILDNEMRQIPGLKSLVSMFSKSIDELNQMIILLQFGRLNAKYHHTLFETT